MKQDNIFRKKVLSLSSRDRGGIPSEDSQLGWGSTNTKIYLKFHLYYSQ